MFMDETIRGRRSAASGLRAKHGGVRWVCAIGLALSILSEGRAQIDPTRRQLIQVGYNQPLEGKGPLAAYGFYYDNRPDFLQQSNLTLRLAVAPVYLDTELGIRGVLTPHTDLGLGLAGGGYAGSFSEVRDGNLLRRESFIGHGGKLSLNLYHLFNPQQRIPLYLVVRNEFLYTAFAKDDETGVLFDLPANQPGYNLRAGLRWGGAEPLMLPPVAMELSAWYEGQFRGAPGRYGYLNDREVEAQTHLFWGRALLVYTTEKRGNNFSLSITAGTSINADRFSAYRVGGFLPLVSEFPLTLPGYYFEEFFARQFVLFGGGYVVPLDAKRRWSLYVAGGLAWMDYQPGLAGPSPWVSGLGGGLIFRSPSGAWQVLAGYGYGFNAVRNYGGGGQNVGILVQFDFKQAKANILSPGVNPNYSRGLPSFLRLFQ